MQNTPYALYGESIFTSFRSLGGKIPALTLHLNRLYSACNEYYLNGSKTYADFFSYFLADFDFESMAKENHNHYFRLTIYSENRNSFTAKELGLADLKIDLKILKVSSTSFKKALSLPSPYSSEVCLLKSGSYFQNLYLRKKALRAGADDALMFFGDEYTEATTSNLIVRKNDEYFSPSAAGVFRGISLKLFDDFLATKKKKLVFKKILKKELAQYDGVYFINSVKLLTSINQVDDLYFNEDTQLPTEYKEYLERL